MKTVRVFRQVLLGILMVGMLPAFATVPGKPAVPSSVVEQVDQEKIYRMEQRLKEIKAMDLNKLSRSEKKALRKEVKEIEKTMDVGGGVYISVGALILIIILLIILL